ncbi:MAG: hypothetical protein V4507_10445 [Verrucomicrobiota bacterium]
MRFQIVTIQPEGYLHSRCFEEVSELLELSLRDLGQEALRTINRLHPQGINVILGYHLLPDPSLLGSAPFGIYQLEHLSALPEWLQKRSLSILEKAQWIWDYSEANREWLRERGLESSLVAPGYHPQMRRIEQASHRDVDLLFYGAVSPRRLKILENLIQKVPRLKILEGVYGAERDQWIARSKMILNIHSYERPLFEAVRLSYLFNNHCAVCSEPSEGSIFEGLPSTVFDESRLDDLTRLLQNKAELDAIQEKDGKLFETHYPMVEILHRALDSV